MSYILDALMKSEKERQRGGIPSLDSQQDNENKPPKKKRWRYWLIAALVLNAVVLLWWMRPWETKQNAPSGSAAPQATVQKRPVAKETAAPAVAGISEMAANKTPVPEPALKSVPKPVPAQMQKQVPPDHPAGEYSNYNRAYNVVQKQVPSDSRKITRSVSGQLRRPVAASAPEVKSDEQAAKELSSMQKAAPDDSAAGDESLEADGGTAEELSAEAPNDAEFGEASGEVVQNGMEKSAVEEKQPAPAAAAATKKTLQPVTTAPDISQLPASVLQGLPDIIISLHLYSKIPKRRKVVVNGKMVGEGDQVDNLVVEEITPDGVIFGFQGRRFHKAVFR